MWEGKTLRGFQGFIRVVQLTLSEHLLHPTPLAGSEDSSVTKRREQGEVFRVARQQGEFMDPTSAMSCRWRRAHEPGHGFRPHF